MIEITRIIDVIIIIKNVSLITLITIRVKIILNILNK